MFADTLSYVAIVAHEPDQTVRRLVAIFGLAPFEVEAPGGRLGGVAVGRSSILVLPPGHALADGRDRTGIDHLAIGIGDLTAATAEATSRGFRPGAGSPGIEGHQSVKLPADRLDGVRVRLTTWTPPRPASGYRTRNSQRPHPEVLGEAEPRRTHDGGTSFEAELRSAPQDEEGRNSSSVSAIPGLVSRIDHLGVASADAQEAARVFRDGLGLPVESMQTDVETIVAVESFTSDRWGVVQHSRPARVAGGLRVAFLTVGDTELEFLSNLRTEHSVEMQAGAAGTTKQDQGAIAGYVAKHGPGLHHIALKTDDIDGVLARAQDAGLPLIDRRGRPGSRAGRIGFFKPAAFGGVLFHLVERPGE